MNILNCTFSNGYIFLFTTIKKILNAIIKHKIDLAIIIILQLDFDSTKFFPNQLCHQTLLCTCLYLI